MAWYTGLFGGTSFTGHIDFDILPVSVLLNHLVHTGMDGVPQAVCDGSSGRICDLVNQGQIIAGTTVCNRCCIAGQLYCGISVVTLSHGRWCFCLIRNTWCTFIHLDTILLIKTEHGSILGQFGNTGGIIRFSIGSTQITKTDTNCIEEVVTGLLNRSGQTN